MQVKTERPKVFDASRLKVGVVVARFNGAVTEKLLENALTKLAEYKVSGKNIKVVKVSGSVEIPFVLARLAQTKKYNCLVALGAVIKGETDHYTFVCKMIQEGVLRVMLDYSIPVGFGVLTTENLTQAEERVGFGGDSVAAALELANLDL